MYYKRKIMFVVFENQNNVEYNTLCKNVCNVAFSFVRAVPVQVWSF